MATRVYLEIGQACPNGHLVTEDIAYVYPKGSKLEGRVICKVCRMNWQRRRKGLPESDTVGVWNKYKTHCKNGHEFTPENTMNKPDGSRGCKKCHALHTRKRTYGLQWGDFEKMMEKQNRECAICKEHFVEDAGASVDHDHETGAVRGLLCNNCNNGLGRFFDDPVRLKSAARYIEVYLRRTAKAKS